jgi:hypothetical protein
LEGFAMTKYDLLIKDGHLVDTANQREGRYDFFYLTGSTG